MDMYGIVETIAGSDEGFEDGDALNSKFYRPNGVCIDRDNGNIIVCDTFNDKIRRINQNGTVETIAGSDERFEDGDALNSKFYRPKGICIDRDNGNIIVCDTYNHKIRRIILRQQPNTNDNFKKKKR